jgi:hypothetical protein
MKKLYLFFLVLLLHASSGAQTIDVLGQCITNTITLSPVAEQVNGKIAYQGTGTVDGNAGVTVNIYWIGAPDNVWVLDFDGQPYFQSSCNTNEPPSSPNVDCPWTVVTETTCTGAAALSITGSGVLAIRLTSFTGTKSNGKVLLNWKTASETNNKAFEVQRSTDGVNWQMIGSVPGAMHSSTERQYHFTDNMPAAGKNYYRLLQKDIDGRFSYSGIVIIEIFGDHFQVLNTPVRGVYQLLVQSAKAVELSLYDASGRKAWSLKAANGIYKLDLSSQPSGIYLLQVRMKDEVRTQKIINP